VSPQDPGRVSNLTASRLPATINHHLYNVTDCTRWTLNLTEIWLIQYTSDCMCFKISFVSVDRCSLVHVPLSKPMARTCFRICL
jgi:hypothetical protein